MKILVVDDSKAMRLLIVRALRGIGLPEATYLEAADGNAALCAVQNQRPELVVSDFNMPGMTGMDLLRAIRATGNPLCFGFITSELSTQLREEAEGAGARFVITKPFTPASLSQALTAVIAGLGGGALEAGEEAPVLNQRQAAFATAPQVASILEVLLRRAVTATAAPAVALPPRKGQIVAEYMRAADGSVIGYGICDWACAVRLGAALSLIPPAAAAEAIGTGEADDTLVENFHEVLNVLSRLFDRDHSSRVYLSQVHRRGEALSPELAARLVKPVARIDACVDISGYGKGNLTLLSVS